MTADHGIGQTQIFNHRLQFSRMIPADLTTEDDGELVGLADRAIGIHQSLAEPIHGSTPRKDQVVAKLGSVLGHYPKLNLREEQSVFHARLLPFSGSEEWNQLCEPFAPAAGEI